MELTEFAYARNPTKTVCTRKPSMRNISAGNVFSKPENLDLVVCVMENLVGQDWLLCSQISCKMTKQQVEILVGY